MEYLDDRRGFKIIITEFEAPKAVDDWTVLLGEYVHNIRSALDNLAFALARIENDPPKDPGKIAFPIFLEKSKFENNGRDKLSQLPEKAAKLIGMLQPFTRDGSAQHGTPESDALLLINNLSNSDKHRKPSIIFMAPTKLVHNFLVVFRSDQDAIDSEPHHIKISPGSLEHGKVLIEYTTNSPVEKVVGSLVGTAVVLLETPNGPLELIQLCKGMHYYTSLVVSQFDHFFK